MRKEKKIIIKAKIDRRRKMIRISMNSRKLLINCLKRIWKKQLPIPIFKTLSQIKEPRQPSIRNRH